MTLEFFKSNRDFFVMSFINHFFKFKLRHSEESDSPLFTSFNILPQHPMNNFFLNLILGYASSSSGSSGAGLYTDNSYDNTYGSQYPYSNSYTGYAGVGGSPYAVPVAPFANPYDFQNAFAQYYNSISQFNQKYG